jgi:lysophospholipase L1-like esterase
MSTNKRPAKRKIWKIAVPVVAVLLAVQWTFIGWRYNFGPMKGLGEMRLSRMQGNGAEYNFDKIQRLADSPLEGKTVLFLGSSVTNGASSLHNSLPEYFTARMGCRSIKEAVDGTTLVDNGSNSYIQRMLTNVDSAEEIGLLVCQLSTNDASKKMPLGKLQGGNNLEAFDTDTVTGAIEYIICYARKTWNCPVVFYTNARYDSLEYAAMVDRLHEIAEAQEVGVLDLWTDDSFNTISDADRAIFMYDTIHPTKAGYRDWWGPELERQLCEYLAEG